MTRAHWVSDRGRYTCSPEHGGMFLVVSFAALGDADEHATPREVWRRYEGTEECTTCVRHDLEAAA